MTAFIATITDPSDPVLMGLARPDSVEALLIENEIRRLLVVHGIQVEGADKDPTNVTFDYYAPMRSTGFPRGIKYVADQSANNKKVTASASSVKFLEEKVPIIMADLATFIRSNIPEMVGRMVAFWIKTQETAKYTEAEITI